MNKLLLSIAAISLIMVTSSFASFVSLENGTESIANVDVVSDNNDGTTIAISVSGFERETISVNGVNYDRILLNERAKSEVVGLPELPIVRVTLQIPGDASVDVSLKSLNETTLSGYTLYPAQPPVLEGEAEPPFTIDNAFYSGSSSVVTENISLSDPAVMREIRLVTVAFRPFEFDPITNDLTVITDAVVTVTYGDGPTENTIGTFNTYSPYWTSAYEKLAVNYKSKAAQPEETRFYTQYLVITTEALKDEAEEIAEFHSKLGLRSVVVTTDETGTSRNDIKDYIEEMYEEVSPPALEAVLMCGDVNSVQDGRWPGSSFSSEWWYGCITGSPDLYADIYVGRMSTDDATELTNQINKTKKYMTTPPTNGWLDKTVLIAHEEDAPGKYTACKESIRTASYSDFTPTFATLYGYLGHTNAEVSSAINNGVGVVNYRGHGDNTSWTSWNRPGYEYYDNADFAALTNGDMTPIVLNIACLNGNIPVSECFGEAQLNANDGAVAAIAASDPSYTYPNHEFDEELYNAIYDESISEMSAILTFANHWLLANSEWPTLAPTNVKMYMVLGDPMLKVWQRTPTSTLVASHPSSYTSGPFTVTVTSGGSAVSGAEVILYQPSDPVVFPLEKATTNGSGVATFTGLEDWARGSVDLYVSATKDGSIPYMGSCGVTKDLLKDVSFRVEAIASDSKSSSARIKAEWSVSDSSEITGYNLFRRERDIIALRSIGDSNTSSLSAESDNEWVRINEDILKGKSSASFVDNPGVGEFEYMLEIITVDESLFTGAVTANSSADPVIVKVFALGQNQPNPFNGSSTISFALPRTCSVDLSVYDIKGRKVTTVASGEYQPGDYSAEVSGLSSGIYLYRLEAGEFVSTKKMVVK